MNQKVVNKIQAEKSSFEVRVEPGDYNGLELFRPREEPVNIRRVGAMARDLLNFQHRVEESVIVLRRSVISIDMSRDDLLSEIHPSKILPPEVLWAMLLLQPLRKNGMPEKGIMLGNESMWTVLPVLRPQSSGDRAFLGVTWFGGGWTISERLYKGDEETPSESLIEAGTVLILPEF